MTKLTIIGAGSAVFTKNIVTDILSIIASSAALAISGMPFLDQLEHQELVLSMENMF